MHRKNYICAMKRIVIMFFAGLFALVASAQERFGGVVEFDTAIHDFGDVLTSDGPLSCQFNMKNVSGKPIVIYNVTTSCGCTDAEWSKEPIQPNETTSISVTYTNEDDFPFDKTITLYVSDVNKPILLKISGVARRKPEPLENMYPVHFGPVGLKTTDLKVGNIEMGGSRSDQTQIANLSNSPLDMEFTDISDGLNLKVEPNPVPARGTGTLSYTVNSREGVWGKNHYHATVVSNGTKEGEFTVEGFTRANFNSQTEEQKKNAPNPLFMSSTWQMGKVEVGTVITAEWEFSNIGKQPLEVYKVDIDSPNATHTAIPTTEADGKNSFSVTLDTTGMPAGEALVIVTLTTNAPSRPIVNLFITGWIL